MQSAYDFAILNEWSGKTEINAETYIASSVVAAGKKDSDNTFSGIVLGDLEEWNTDKTNSILTTGLYGLSKGILTFYLTDKG
jgi:hypothetical protein